MEALPRGYRFSRITHQAGIHGDRMRLSHGSVGPEPDQLPQSAFEAEHGVCKRFESRRADRMGRTDPPEDFLVARQMKAQVLLQPQNVADQRGALFFLVGTVRHPEQQRNPANKQDERQPRQYP